MRHRSERASAWLGLGLSLACLVSMLAMGAFVARGASQQAERAVPETMLPWVLILNTRFTDGKVTTVVVPNCGAVVEPCVYYHEAGCHDAAETYEAQAVMPTNPEGVNLVVMAVAICIPAPRGLVPSR